jgi:glycosyltransferase involved in cell wall biosynthesis
MAGGGPLEASLRQRAVDLALGEAVTWIPFSENVASIYAQIGTLVLASDYEGWARIVVEALACGIPVIMTDVGCAGEVLRDGIEGRVVPIGDRAALVQAMKDAADSFRHQLWSVAAKLRAAGLETPPQLADRLTDFWKKCLGL